jgi:hypothetical protein
MAQLCCHVVVFNRWEDKTTGLAVVHHNNKKLATTKVSDRAGYKMQ